MYVGGNAAGRHAALNYERLPKRRAPGVSETRLFCLNTLTSTRLSMKHTCLLAVLTCCAVDAEASSIYHGMICIAEEFSSWLGERRLVNRLRMHRHGAEEGGRWEWGAGQN